MPVAVACLRTTKGVVRTTEELNTAGRLSEFVEVGEKLEFDHNVDFTANAVDSVKDWNPAGHHWCAGSASWPTH